MRKALLVILLVTVSAVAAGTIGGGVAMALVRGANPGIARPGGDIEITVQSTALQEAMTLDVRLPTGYAEEPERLYPVLWVTDGRSHLDHATHTAQVLATVGIGEPMIVVAIPNSSVGRSFDFIPEGMGERGGGAEPFLNFILDEALPTLDAELRTDDRDLLLGHSLGGLFVTWAMARSPESFDAWLAFSPSFWVGEGAVTESLGALFAADPEPNTYFFASLGVDEGNQMLRHFDAVLEFIGTHASSTWAWDDEITPGADHGSNPPLSLPTALQSYWESVR